jgi:hypothetical protein
MNYDYPPTLVLCSSLQFARPEDMRKGRAIKNFTLKPIPSSERGLRSAFPTHHS